MVVSRNEGRLSLVKIKSDDQEIEQVSNFKYLGSLISEDGRCLVDVKTIGLLWQRTHSIREKNF